MQIYGVDLNPINKDSVRTDWMKIYKFSNLQYYCSQGYTKHEIVRGWNEESDDTITLGFMPTSPQDLKDILTVVKYIKETFEWEKFLEDGEVAINVLRFPISTIENLKNLVALITKYLEEVTNYC